MIVVSDICFAAGVDVLRQGFVLLFSLDWIVVVKAVRLRVVGA